jgi:hypothetical protein
MVTTLDDDRRLLPFGQLPGVRLGGLVAVQIAGLDLNAAWSREPVTLGAGGCARGRLYVWLTLHDQLYHRHQLA